MIGFDSDLKAWMENSHKSLGYTTVSRLVNGVMREFMETKTKPPEDGAPEIITPEEEQSRIIETMGQLNEKFDDKFEAIRTLRTRDIKKIENADDVQKFVDDLWHEVMKEDGYVRRKGKVISISRADLKEYQNLGMLRLRFDQLSAQLQKKEQEQQPSKSVSPKPSS